MKQVVTTEKKPVKLWLDNIEASALEQARNLANLPFTFKHVAVMPDAHLGYGMPIGGVMASEDMVIPNAVGVDIGCGMCAMKTSLTSLSTENLKAIIVQIRNSVPVGFKHHKKKQDKSYMPRIKGDLLEDYPILSLEYQNALTQLGTLGGGNHFIEIQKGNDGHIWIMLHSGSRNIGLKVANHYNKLATQLNRKWGSTIPTQWQLAFLPIQSKEGQDYLREMNYCVEFAYANRKLIMKRVQDAILSVVQPVFFDSIINIAHNYAALETHFHKNVLVHRKGATRALDGEIGIIPGSQGTPSYIVRGKGNSESFSSCSHGAGRKMGRKQAQRQLDLEKEKKRLDAQGIVHALHRKADLDEAAGAYKNIHEVIDNQLDLVEVLIELHPMAVLKG